MAEFIADCIQKHTLERSSSVGNSDGETAVLGEEPLTEQTFRKRRILSVLIDDRFPHALGFVAEFGAVRTWPATRCPAL